VTRFGPPAIVLSVLALFPPVLGVASAQDIDPAYLPPPTDLGDSQSDLAAPETSLDTPQLPGDAPSWTRERTTGNRAGTVENTQRYRISDDGNNYLREHVVVNPRGEMVQTRERSQTEEGYQRRWLRTFTAPDGTQLRRHERTVSGTDPYNYTRQHEITLRDGRTISHAQTRSWDGTTGTMERTFIGPNGQTRQFQHAWAPDDPLPVEPMPAPGEPRSPETTVPDTMTGLAAPIVEGSAPPPPVERPKKLSWLEKLNPFRGVAGSWRSSGTVPPHRSGFTVGSGARGSIRSSHHRLSTTQPGQPSPNSRRPAWAGVKGVAPPKALGPKMGSVPQSHGRGNR
jgi:hypothetical protein